MSKPKTFLFFPIETGIAHMTRSFAVAQELDKRGNTIVFALPARKHSLLGNAKNIQLINIQGYTQEDSSVFIPRLKDPSFLLPLARQEYSIIQKHKPDCVVVDFRVSALASCAVAGVPTVFLTGSGGLPYGCRLPNPGFPAVVFNAIVPFLHKIIWKEKRNYVASLTTVSRKLGKQFTLAELFARMEYIIPETPDYLTPLNPSLRLHYVGPIHWDGFNDYSPQWLSTINKDGKTIYLTFGGTGFDAKKLINTSVLLLDHGFRVIVSTGMIAEPSDFPRRSNLFVARYLPGREVSRRVDLVICHGGYGTMTDAIMVGTPAIAAPFNPDQILHGLRLQELGVGACVFRFDATFLINLLKLDWARFEKAGRSISPVQILGYVRDVLANREKYEKAIRAFTKQLPERSATQLAADVLEKYVKN